MRALLREGQHEYRQWVLSLGEDPRSPVPVGLLSHCDLSYAIPKASALVPAAYVTKHELASALLTKVEELEALKLGFDCWPGIWDALALAHFESICPRKPTGEWAPNRVEHYVYDLTHTKSGSLAYRHRIYGPVTLYRVGRESVKPFFQMSPCVLGDYEESIGSRQEIAGNAVALKVLKSLYAKNDGTGLLTGFTGTRRYPGFNRKLATPGSIRRFASMWKQLKRTYDLAGISCDGLLGLLPAEFHGWLAR